MKKTRGFSDKEIKELAKMTETAKEENRGLDGVFKEFAATHGRAKGSVRNYYYKLIANIKSGGAENKYFSDIPTVNRPRAFDDREEKLLICAINDGAKQNKSVRRTLNELSGGDGKLMLRYQNKYRNMLSRKPEVFNSFQGKNDKLTIDETENYYKKVPDFTLNRLKTEINQLVKNIAIKTKEENDFLKKENLRLKDENSALRSILRSSALISETNRLNYAAFDANHAQGGTNVTQ